MNELVFDKGTLLLRGIQKDGTENLPSPFLWDDRVSAYRAPAYYYSKIQAELNDISDQALCYQAPPVIHKTPALRLIGMLSKCFWLIPVLK